MAAWLALRTGARLHAAARSTLASRVLRCLRVSCTAPHAAAAGLALQAAGGACAEVEGCVIVDDGGGIGAAPGAVLAVRRDPCAWARACALRDAMCGVGGAGAAAQRASAVVPRSPKVFALLQAGGAARGASCVGWCSNARAGVGAAESGRGALQRRRRCRERLWRCA